MSLATAKRSIALRSQEAVDSVQESARLFRALLEGDPGNFTYQRDLAIGLKELGRRLLRVGRSHEAVDALQEAVRLHQVLLEGDRGNVRYQRELASVLDSLGSISVRRE
jgi:hypothetical protein